jgi:hypothetical protein
VVVPAWARGGGLRAVSNATILLTVPLTIP